MAVILYTKNGSDMYKKKFAWREETRDGLLKVPKEIGPYYSSEPFNGYKEYFDSEQSAVDHLHSLKKRFPHVLSNQYVLITLYEDDYEY